jgi:hypothetical protein
VAVDLVEALVAQRPAVGGRQVAVHPVLAGLVDELHALRALVGAQAGDQLQARVDRRQQLEVVVHDRVAHLAHDRVGSGVSHGGHASKRRALCPWRLALPPGGG